MDDGKAHHPKQLFHYSTSPKLEQFMNTQKPVVESHSAPPFQPLHLYFAFLYYIGVAPFKPVYDKETRRWTLSKFWLQQIFSLLVWAANCIFIGTNLLKGKIEVNWTTNSSKKYFQFVGRVLYYLQTFLFFWKLYSRAGQRCMEHLANEVQRVSKTAPSWKQRLCQGVTLLGLVIATVAIWVLTMLVRDRLNNFEEGWFQAAMALGRQRFHIGNGSKAAAPLPETAGNVAAGVSHLLLSTMFTLIQASFEVLFLISIPLTIWIPTVKFSKFVEGAAVVLGSPATQLTNLEDKTALKQLILEEFYKVKSLVDGVNSAFGVLITAWFIALAFEIIFNFKFVMQSGEVKVVAILVIAIGVLLTLLLTSAEVYRKVSCFKSWFASKECRELLRRNQMNDHADWSVEVSEVKDASVGIGMDGVYEISYSFICQVLAVCITLFIVSYEM